jgi:hypothetical protein
VVWFEKSVQAHRYRHGNGRYGIICDASPAVAQITPHFSGVGFSINLSHVFGNTVGQISCPGF